MCSHLELQDQIPSRVLEVLKGIDVNDYASIYAAIDVVRVMAVHFPMNAYDLKINGSDAHPLKSIDQDQLVEIALQTVDYILLCISFSKLFQSHEFCMNFSLTFSPLKAL